MAESEIRQGQGSSATTTMALDMSSDDIGEREAIDELAARREDLAITINDLDLSKPSILPSLISLQLCLVLLGAAIALVVLPYFRPEFPRQVSTIGAFAVAILAFACYVSFRKFSIDYEQRRLYGNLVQRATYLARLSDELLSAEFSGHASNGRKA